MKVVLLIIAGYCVGLVEGWNHGAWSTTALTGLFWLPVAFTAHRLQQWVAEREAR